MDIKNLSVSFSKEIKAIDCLDLSVPDGKNSIVIGESGSGKSVMLAAILRILPSSARVSGEVLLNDENILAIPEKEMEKIRGDAIAYIPQSGGNSMNPLLTVGFQIAEPLVERKTVPKSKAWETAVRWMKKLNLGSEERLASAYPHTLSGGMRQRALIAMGAIVGAPILLADEPTKGLDGERIETVTELLSKLDDRTLLCVSHDLRFVRAIADYVCVMYASQMVEYSPCKDFFENPLHPYSQMTLKAMPENGLHASMGFAPSHKEFALLGCHFYDRCPYHSEQCKMPPPMVQQGQRKVRCWRYAD